MYIKEFLEKYRDKKIKLFVDMDGVIADYNVGVPSNYDRKRPLYDSLKKLEEVSNMENVEMHILSVTRMNGGYEQKNYWLDKFAPFFRKENRTIISREANGFEKSSNLKSNFVKNLERTNESVIIIIDDDPLILKEIAKNNKDIILLKDTALVD